MRSFPGVLAYCVSKAGVDQLTRCAALELAPKGVRVNAVNPGVVVSNLHRRSGMTEENYAAFLERSKETHPLGRAGTARRDRRPDRVPRVGQGRAGSRARRSRSTAAGTSPARADHARLAPSHEDAAPSRSASTLHAGESVCASRRPSRRRRSRHTAASVTAAAEQRAKPRPRRRFEDDARPPGRSTRSTSARHRFRVSGVSVGNRSRTSATSKLPASYGNASHGARATSTSAPSRSMAAPPCAHRASSASTRSARPVRPAFVASAAISARIDARRRPATDRPASRPPSSPSAAHAASFCETRTHACVVIRRSRAQNRLTIQLAAEFSPSQDDIVAGCEKSGKNREGRRETRHPAGRPRRRQHDDDRRRASRSGADSRSRSAR